MSVTAWTFNVEYKDLYVCIDTVNGKIMPGAIGQWVFDYARQVSPSVTKSDWWKTYKKLKAYQAIGVSKNYEEYIDLLRKYNNTRNKLQAPDYTPWSDVLIARENHRLIIKGLYKAEPSREVDFEKAYRKVSFKKQTRYIVQKILTMTTDDV